MRLTRPSTEPSRRRLVRRRLVAAAATAAMLASASAVAVAPGASAATVPTAVAGGTWSSSFETTDPAVTEDTTYVGTGVTGYTPSSNVTGIKYAPGSLLGDLSAVTASAENPPSELAEYAADGASSTKWLARSTTGWLQFQLSSAKTATKYTLTTANDSSGRDPKSWTVQGSNDGSTWSTLDTQTDQLSGATRQTTYSYTVATPGAYSYYRLNITANNGDSLLQLADWELLDGTSNPASATPMRALESTGPVTSSTAKIGVGFTGTASLRYIGSHMAAGDASTTNVLYSGLDVPIGSQSELSYVVFPVLDEADLTYPATYVAVDVEYTDADGSNPALLSSDPDLTDQYGYGITAADQGRAKTLFTDQWNKVRIDLSSLAGKTITKILLTYSNPDGTATTAFQGWLDDIAIKDATTIDSSSLTNYVDTRAGTNSSSSYSRGNNIPATAVPNGFNFFVPQTDAGSTTDLYKYQQSNNSVNRPTLQGIGISHEPSRWMSDRDSMSVMPSLSTDTAPDASLSGRALSFSHDDEVAQPDYYSVAFDDGIKAEVTPSDHAGVYRFTFPESASTGTVLLDQVSGSSSFIYDTVNKDTVTGYVDNTNNGATRMYFSVAFDRAATSGVTASGRTTALAMKFDTSSDKTVEMRIATSFISVEQATSNMDQEVTGKTFDQVRSAAQELWNERLSVVHDVAGATQTQLVSLYSGLYRLNLYPNSQFEHTGKGSADGYQYASPVNSTSGSATATTTNAQINDGKIYVNNGFWDTYRTAWPLYELLYPKLANQLIDGFLEQYRAGGWVARWSSPGYSDSMTGTSSDAAFAEAYISGDMPTDLAEEAYAAALKNATVASTDSKVGRKSLTTSIFLGYTPVTQGESVSWGLEGFINDYAIAQMARKLSTDPDVSSDAARERYAEEADYLDARAQDYVNMFDPSVDFFQGRNADGTFDKSASSFDPLSWGGAFTETDGWNFAFHVPYDVDGLASLYGGQQGLLDKLDTFFATPEKADRPGTYGGAIHEMYEARGVRMGQWGASNQVSFHIPYIYAAAGKPSKTQAIVREAVERLYVGTEIGQGYPGDEDNGSMAAAYVYGALGFYPLAIGSGSYTIGSPLYSSVKVTPLDGSGTLTINAANNGHDDAYIQSASLDGEAWSSVDLPVSAITGGDHTLSFTMGSTASTWGETTLAATSPTAATDLTTAGTATVAASDGTTTANLVDNTSATSATFSSTTPSVTIALSGGAQSASRYTLTSAAAGSADPASWTLYGSNDGTRWQAIDSRSDETFAWRSQTRPFEIQKPGEYSSYKLAITATSTGGAPTVAEIELYDGGAAVAPEPVASTTTLTADRTSVAAGGSVTLSVRAPSDATGTATILDSGASLGTVGLVGGAATFTAENLAAGVHTFTAVYSGDSYYAGSTSAPVTVDVAPKGTTTQVVVAAPRFSSTTQVYGAVAAKRAKVAVTVAGATSGTVTFRSGALVLGTAPVVKAGSTYAATLTLPADLALGSYRSVIATLVSGTTTVASPASAQTLTVVKATTAKVKVKGKKYKKGKKATVTVKVAALSNGQVATGKVVVRVGKKKARTVSLTAAKKGKVKVKIAKRFTKAKKIKVKAVFQPQDAAHVASKTSKKVVLKAKKK